MLVAPWSMMLAAGYSKESSDGYEKATTIGGNPAVEKWDKRNKRGELNILVGKRFMVDDRRQRPVDYQGPEGVRVGDGLRRDRGVEIAPGLAGDPCGHPRLKAGAMAAAIAETPPSADHPRRSGTYARR